MMKRRATLFLLAALALLTGMTGCGTRSILVPVTRPADIDLRGADTILVLPTLAADGRVFTRSVAAEIDSVLPRRMTEQGRLILSGKPEAGAPSMFTAAGSVSRRALRWWTQRHGGELLLHCAVADSRLHEETAAAEIQSTITPGSVKYVRQGRAEARCRIVLVDVRRELLLFDDTLHVFARDETHATDEDPPPLDPHAFAMTLAGDIAGRFAEAARPVRDRDVVTFLVDDDFPEIDAAITYAEEGRWNLAAEVLQRLAEKAGDAEDADIVWYDLGLVHQYDGNFKDGLAAFDRAIAIRDRSRYRHARAELLRIEAAFLDRLERERK